MKGMIGHRWVGLRFLTVCFVLAICAGALTAQAQVSGQPSGQQAPPNWALETPKEPVVFPGADQPPEGQYDPYGDYLPTDGGMKSSTKIILWVSIGIVLLLLHVFIAVFIAMDGKRRNIGGYAGWAVFGAVPVLGLIGLFAYVLAAQPKGPDDDTLRKIFEEGEKRAKASMEPQLRDAQARIQQMEQEMQRAPIEEKDITQILELEKGVASIAFQYMTGDKMNSFESLIVRDPLTKSPKRVIVGRDAKSGAEIVLPWDKGVSNPHCQISVDEEGYYVYDLNSSNGTLIKKDGQTEWQKIFGRMHIADRDMLKIGSTIFKVIVTEPEKDILPGDEKGFASDLKNQTSGSTPSVQG